MKEAKKIKPKQQKEVEVSAHLLTSHFFQFHRWYARNWLNKILVGFSLTLQIAMIVLFAFNYGFPIGIVSATIGLLLLIKVWRTTIWKIRVNATYKPALFVYFLKANSLCRIETVYRKNRPKEIVYSSARLVYSADPHKGLFYVKFFKDGDQYTQHLRDLEVPLQGLLKLPIEEKRETPGTVLYVFSTADPRRIRVKNENENERWFNTTQAIPLNSNLTWNIQKQPHALICGGTGSGKTTFINYLLIAFKRLKADLYVADPKNSDLGSLKSILGADYVATDTNAIARVCRLVKETMEARYREYKDNPKKFKYGASYVDYGLFPVFLIFDEVGAFRAAADKKVYLEVFANLTEIILKGREMGVFVVLSTQQPNANNIPTELRDNLSFRLALGAMSNEGYRMIFGETVKDLGTIQGAGKGYLLLDGLGWERPKRYEAPYIDYETYDFIKELKKYAKKK